MAEICSGVRKAIDFLNGMMAERPEDMQAKYWQCIAGFLAKLELQERNEVLGKLLAGLVSEEDSCITLLCHAPFGSSTWQHVDRLCNRLRQRYWREVVPYWHGHDATETATFVDELLNVDRPCAAFHAAQVDWKQLDSPRLIRLLTEVATNDAEPAGYYQVDEYYISNALETLEQRGDTSQENLARLEFLFVIPLENSEHGIRNLETQLAETPTLFVEALVRAFKRNDGGEDPAEWQVSSSDSRAAVSIAAHTLLTNASRVPGTQADGSIDLDELIAWLEQTRALARDYGRIEAGDEMIGQLISRCPPGADGVWPCEPVREAIDGVGSQDIATGMVIGIRNGRGETWRGDGGAQERGLAEQYRSWAREVAFEYPFTANMLEQVAASYDHEAKWWDNEDGVRQRLEH